MEMLTYKAAIYPIEIEVAQKPDEVFDQIIDLAKWWPEDIEGKAIGVGTEFGLSVGDGHYSKNRVTDFERSKKFAWVTIESIRKADGFDWTGTKMIFELTRQGNNTHIKYTYDGVVLEPEADRLIQICDLTIKDFLYNYLTYGKTKQDFSITIEFDKPVEDVFKALTQNVVKWWGGKDLTGSTTRLNDEFVIHHTGAHYSKQKVVALVPNKKLVWLVTDSELNWLKQNKQEWTDTKLIFELTIEANKTQLRFTHVGLTPDKECYNTCSYNGWDIVIKDYLYNYITEGKAHF